MTNQFRLMKILGFGLVTMGLGAFPLFVGYRPPYNPIVFQSLMFGMLVLPIIGLMCYAWGKGRSLFWGAMGLLPFVGPVFCLAAITVDDLLAKLSTPKLVRGLVTSIVAVSGPAVILAIVIPVYFQMQARSHQSEARLQQNVAHNPAKEATKTEMTAGEKIYQQFAADMRKYETVNHFPDLLKEIRKTVPSAKIRSFSYLKSSMIDDPMFNQVVALEKGVHPYHVAGDWDCDGKKDQAVILEKPTIQVLAVFGSGMALTFDEVGDQLGAGEPGTHSVFVPDGNGKETFEAKCGFINVDYWGKGGFALVADIESKKLVQYWTSD